MEFKCLEFSKRRHSYKIAYKDGVNSEFKVFLSNYEIEVFKKILSHIIMHAYFTYSYTEKLSVDDLSDILTRCYECIEVKDNQRALNTELVEINMSLTESMKLYDNVYYDDSLCVDTLSDIMIETLNKNSERFMFINTSLLLPKWIQGSTLSLDLALEMKVTHGGVLLQGLEFMSDQDKKKIEEFYPKCKFYGKEYLFFDFKDFQSYRYSFEWTGKHIKVLEVNETEDSETVIIKSLVLGAILKKSDICFPIQNIKELDLIKTMLRFK